MIKFSGPAFAKVDNRLMSLQLVEQGLTDAAMFTADGEVVQPAEVLYNKPVMMERGSFRPVTNVTLEMLDCAVRQLQQDFPPAQDLVAIMEMTLNNLMSELDSTTASNRLKMALLAPMPMASTVAATAVNAGARRSTRAAYRKSCQRVIMDVGRSVSPPALSQIK